MKPPIVNLIAAAALGVVMCVPLATTGEARVGEKQGALERRVLRNKLGYEYGEELYERKLREAPYKNLMPMLEEFESFQMAYYWKSADPENTSRNDFRDQAYPDGWDYHVLYSGGVSVFEYYRRNGRAVSEFEKHAILNINRGDSKWIEREALMEVVEGQESPVANDSFIGFDYERADGRLRAIVANHYIYIFSKEFDARVKEYADKLQEEQDLEDRDAAPASVLGF